MASAPPGETAIVDGLSRALGLPRPFPHEDNRAFATCETWQQLAAALAAQPVAVRPLGYYRTPDSVDMYVLSCVLMWIGEGQFGDFCGRPRLLLLIGTGMWTVYLQL